MLWFGIVSVSMKEIEIEFQHNANKTGTQIFTRIKREVNSNGKAVYIYQRAREDDGKIFGFEVFVPTITKAGTVQTFPNGMTQTVEEDMENYPGASVFGYKAWFCSTLENAEKRFDWIMKGKPVAVADEKKTVAKVEIHKEPKVPTALSVKPHRGRSKGKRPDLMVPFGEFSVKNMADANKVEPVVVANFLKQHPGLVKFTREERRSVRGPMTKLFTKSS